MGWGPKFNHNITTFSPEAILLSLGANSSQLDYVSLLGRLRAIIVAEVTVTAKELNYLLQVEYRKDIDDIEEYSVLGRYWMVLQAALSQSGQVGVTWDKGIVQAKFVDTNLLGGVKELQEIQHAAYPYSTGNLAAWTSMYNRWLEGRDNRILLTLFKRLDIMQSMGSAPFAELIETGNDMYPAYPTHGAKGTLKSFKPVYRSKMRAAYQRVLLLAEKLVNSTLSWKLTPDTIMLEGKIIKRGFSWKSRAGNTIFMSYGTQRVVAGRLSGSGFIISPVGEILKSWRGWVPR